ncbi:zonadhesin [Caerostris darwini]|uniref:Zonadhesin n=1 Tax=Caerostris darwini TaxID=1538125 RepID=A0AAV4SE15_9ARAC|nr:zonadhesin [Caerostris darwini]
MNSVKLFFFILFITVLYKVHCQCPPNEIEEECVDFCNTCEDEAPCLDVCIPGCNCQPGFLRDAEGTCVPWRMCRSSTEKCPPNERFHPCSGGCQKNCSNYDDLLMCPAACVPGCICEDGFVRGPDKKCIKPDRCPRLVTKPPIRTRTSCPLNEEMSRCSALCQRSCANFKDPDPFCPKVCVSGCVCKTGMVRGPQRICIYPQQCPLRNVTTKRPSSKETVERVYPPEQKYRRCDSYCPIRNRPRLRCPKMCYLGCRCRRQMFQKPKKRLHSS